MRRHPRPSPPLAAALLVVAACAGGSERAAMAVADTQAAAAPTEGAAPVAGGEDTVPAATRRPTTRQDTIRVEGQPLPVELRLATPPSGFPIPFTTYATADFATEPGPDGGERSLRFVAEFGGQRNDSAFVEVAAYPAGLSEAEAVARARRAAGAGADSVSLTPADRAWGMRRWQIRRRAEGGWTLGALVLGRRNDRYFHVLSHYPGDYGDGFGPRLDVILRHWRWGDGTPLDSAAVAR